MKAKFPIQKRIHLMSSASTCGHLLMPSDGGWRLSSLGAGVSSLRMTECLVMLAWTLFFAPLTQLLLHCRVCYLITR